MSLIPSMQPKDPSAVLPYQIDWADWLGATATVQTSTWIITGPDSVLVAGTGASAPSISADGKSTIVWLSGGTLDKWYTVTNRVTTGETPARTDDRSFRIRILQT